MSETPLHWTPTPTPERSGTPIERSETPKFKIEPESRRRVRYTPEIKLKLVQLCIDNQDQYLEMNSIDEFFRFIRVQFAALAGLEQVTGDGSQLRQKVKTMIADRQAAIAAYKMQSGVAIATTDLDQAVDMWIEVVERWKEERDKPVSSQAEEDKAKAAIVRENLVRSLSQKRTFVELEDAPIDFKADSKREQRRKTGTAWAKGKEKETLDEGELIGLMKEIVTSVKSITASMSATSGAAATPGATSVAAATPEATSAAATTPGDSRLDVLEMEVQEMRQMQESSNADIANIRESQQEILLILSELRKHKDK